MDTYGNDSRLHPAREDRCEHQESVSPDDLPDREGRLRPHGRDIEGNAVVLAYGRRRERLLFCCGLTKINKLGSDVRSLAKIECKQRGRVYATTDKYVHWARLPESCRQF